VRRSGLPRWLAAATGAALALGFACRWHRGPPPFYISRIAASEETLSDNLALGMDAAGLKDRLVVALDATGRFAPLAGAGDGGRSPDRPHSYRSRVRVTYTRESDEPDEASGRAEDAGKGAAPEVGTSDAGKPRPAPAAEVNAAGPGAKGAAGSTLRRAEVGVGIELSSPGEDGEPVHAERVASRLFDGSAKGGVEEGSPRNLAFRGALDAALAQAAAQLVLELDAMSESDAQLVADLGSPDGGVRDCAVAQLAERRNPAAVPALIELLRSADHPTVMKALGLLEAMHDQRAVKPLIDLTDKAESELVRQVVYVIGSIGGTEAEAFLFTLENGSQDAQVRAAAAEAAAELRRRRAAADGGVRAARR
jgi:hypothetical protein